MKEQSSLTICIYNTIQLLEALSNDNKFYAGINYKSNPSMQDALKYYLMFNDGEIAKNFRERVKRKRLEKKD